MGKKGKSSNKYRTVEIVKKDIKQQNKKQYAKIAFLAIFLLVLTVGTSYAIFTTTLEGKKEVEVVSGTLTIEYEDKNEINLNNAAPLSNEQGLNTDGYIFTIKNTGTLNGKYTISIEEKEGNTLDNQYIKYSIKEEGGEWSSPALLSSGLIIRENVLIESKKEATYELKMWLDETAPNEVQGKTYSGKIVVNTVQANAKPIVTTNPIIELNGEKVIKIEENTTYTEAGIANIKSEEDLDISNVTTRYEYFDGTTTVQVDSIDTSKTGVYYIYYEIKDSKGYIGLTSRVVNVYKKDTNIPTIILKGEKLISLEYGEEYVESGYSATDIEDLDLTDKVITVGTVNKEVAGTYVIKYIVIDSSGNTSSVTREVIVNDKQREIILVATQEENENLTTRIVIEGETENDKMYYALTNTSSKPSDSEYKEMDLVTNLNNTKKVNPTKLNTTAQTQETYKVLKKFRKVIEVEKNGTYYVHIKDDKKNIETEEVKVTNIDETKPTCVFSDIEYVGVNKNTDLTLTCTDPADIVTKSLSKDYFEVDDKIDIAIGAATKIENGYQYQLTVTGKEAGTTTIKLLSAKIKDQVGNENESVSKEIKITDIKVDATTVKLDLNGTNTKKIEVTGTNAGDISYTSSDNLVATVDNDGTITGVSPGTATITVQEQNSLVTKQINISVVKTLTTKFEKQGSGVTEIGSTKLTCEVVDESGKCDITLPTITVANGYTVIGWSTDKTATTGHEVGKKVSIATEMTFITITKKDEITLTATFNRNGAESQTVSGGTASTANTVTTSCKLPAVYNTETQATECEITTPTITASTATPIVVGYAESSDATTASIEPNTKLTLKSNKTYYAITKNEMKTYTATFNLNGASKQTNSNGTAVAENVTRTCNIPVTYNGVAQATSCKVTSPSITASTTTPSVIGYSTAIDTHTSSWDQSTEKAISGNVTYYAQTYKAKVTKSVAFKIAPSSHVSKITSGSTSVTNTTDSITLTCDLAAVYNGATQATTCNVTSPTITPETGYKNAFFGTSTTATSGTTGGASVSSTTSTYYARALTGNSYTVNYYDGSTLKSSSSATVGTSFTLKTASSMSLSKTGYTFKGWATTSGSTTVAYTDGQSVNNLTTTDSGSVNLYAVWIDDIAPSCTWSTPSTITTQNTTTLTLTCTDTGSKLSSQTLTTSNFSVSSTTYGSVTAVSAPTAVTNGYSYTVTVKGLSSGSTATTNGSFTVSLNANSIKDGANNYNAKTTSSAVTVKGRSYTITYSKGDNVTAIGKTTDSCTSIGTSTSCALTLPTITAVTGYTSNGWYNGTTKIGNAGASYTATANITLTATASDITAPVLSNLTNSSNGEWTNKTISISYNVAETGIGIDYCEYKYDNDEYGSANNWTKSSDTTITNNIANTKYTAERNTNTNIRCKDKAGNISNVLSTPIKIDTTKPSCTWSSAPTVNYNATTTLTLTCTDARSKIPSQTLTTSNFSVSSTTYGSVTAVSDPTAVTNGYSYTVTVKGVAAGSFTVSLNAGIIKDNATNTNAASTSGSITVNKVAATNPTLTGYSGTYDGSSHTITVSGGSGGTIQYSTDNSTWSTTKPTRTSAGTTTVYVRVLGDANHNTTSSISANIAISRKEIAVPTCSAKTYNGASQTLFASGTGYTAGGTTTGTNAGNYTATATPTANYQWNTTSNKTSAQNVTCKINAYNLSNATIASTSSTPYTGSAITPTPAVTVPIPSGNTTTLTSGTHFTYSYANNTNAGTATITVTGTGNYTGTKSSTFTISKLTPTLTQSATSGSAGVGSNATYTIKSNVAGKFSIKSANESYAYATLSSTAEVAANTNVTATVIAQSVNTSAITITVTFTPTSSNYSTTTKTYAFTPKANVRKITFSTGSMGISSLGSTAASCSTTGSSLYCTISGTLPAINPSTGFGNAKWYNGSTVVGSPGDSYSYTLNSDMTLSARVSDLTTKNPNIVWIKDYNATSCVTGDESTCTSYNPCISSAGYTCGKGAIIEYKVNSTTTQRFYTLYDSSDKKTITMISQRNIVPSTTWRASSSATDPLHMITALESATSGWTNVKSQSYFSATSFQYNAYNGCTGVNPSSCTGNPYYFSTRSARARVLTLQEAYYVGCGSANKSCPIWMYNYLNGSTSYGGTNTGDTASRHWTMTVSSASSINSAWTIANTGKLDYTQQLTASYSNGVRAVVKIDRRIFP